MQLLTTQRRLGTAVANVQDVPLPDPPSSQPAAGHRFVSGGLFALILAVFAAAAFPEVVTGSHTFFFRDFGLFGYPLAHYGRECFWRGEVPLWNPLNDCGLPFLAQWNTMTLYPLSLFNALLPLSWSLAVFCVGHLILGGVGMYCLARRWTGSSKAASLAGLVFAFNGLSLNCLMWPNNIAALGWMPWAILAVENGILLGGRGVVYASLAGAMQMLTGAPEVIVFTWVLACVLSVGKIAARNYGWESGLETTQIGVIKPLGRLVFIICLISAIAAAQLLPFLDLLWHSNREAMAGSSDWSMPIWGWASFVVPLFRTMPSFSEVQFQPEQYWTSSYYIGTATLAFGFWAVLANRHWRVKLLACAVGCSLLLALGDSGYVYTGLRKLAPGIAGIRYPIKFVVIAVFGLPLLAAYGVSGYLQLNAATHRKWARLLPLIGSLLAIVAIALVIFDRCFPLQGSDTGKLLRSTATGLGSLLIAVVCLSKVRLLAQAKEQSLVWGALLLAVWFDGMTHAPRQNPTAPRWIYDRNLVDGFLPANPRPAVGGTRAMLTASALETFHSSYIPDPRKYYPSRRVGLFDNVNLLEGIPKIDGFYSMYLNEEAAVESLLYSRTNSYPPHLADFLAVSHVSCPTNLFRWSARNTAQPLITGGQEPIFAKPAAILAALGSDSFDPARVVYLPPEAKATLGSIKNSAVELRPLNHSSQRLEFNVSSATAALVVVAQSFYHPWRCYIDGTPAPIWRANHAYQAIAVNPGSHRVILRYEDTPFLLGAGISLAALVAAFWLWRANPPLSPAL